LLKRRPGVTILSHTSIERVQNERLEKIEEKIQNRKTYYPAAIEKFARKIQGPGAIQKLFFKIEAAQSIPWLWIGVAAAALILILGGVYVLQGQGRTQAAQQQAPTQVAASFPDEISVAEAYAKYKAGTFLLDVRTPEEWSDFHVPNTTFIPLEELADRLNELPRDQEIVVVCRTGNRSQQARDILRQAGFSMVSSMAGGLTQWREAGYPVESGQ
jgi:phage shock protein E